MKDPQEIVIELKAALALTEVHYQSLVENSHDVISLYDANGKYIYLSPGVKRLLDFDSEELVGTYVRDLFHPEERRTIHEFNVNMVKQGKYFINPDFRIRKRDGSYIWIESHSLPIMDENGMLHAVQTTSRDISERKRIEMALMESEVRYRLISENALDFISIHDLSGMYTFVSPSVKEMLGYEPEELMGTSGLTLIHEDDLECLLASPQQDPEKSIPITSYQFRLRKKDKTYIWVEAVTKPMMDEYGSIIQMQTSAREITARKSAEEKLAKSERINRLISTNSRDLISLYDIGDEPKRVYVSPSCKEIMGYEQDELMGRSSFEFMVKEDAERMRKDVHPVTLGGGVTTTEYRAIRKDGTIIWLETISNPFFDANGRMVGFQTSARDITQRKVWEAEIQEAKIEAELATSKFKELLNERSDLIGLLSHDMRAPINQIKGLTQIMQMSLDDRPTLVDCLQRLHQATNRQLSLYRDILFMLKSDQLNVDPRFFKKVPVAMVVGKCYKNLEWEFKNKDVTISVDVPKEIEVNIQLDLFIQAIQNLFSNAIKFSHPGGTVHIDASQDDQDTHIIIHDKGIGFDPIYAETLFDRFTKEGREGTNKEASTGLGLYLVRKIITNHKGKIIAHSNGAGKGATFTIDLPRETDSPPLVTRN